MPSFPLHANVDADSGVMDNGAPAEEVRRTFCCSLRPLIIQGTRDPADGAPSQELPGSFQLIGRKMDEETLIYLGPPSGRYAYYYLSGAAGMRN